MSSHLQIVNYICLKDDWSTYFNQTIYMATRSYPKMNVLLSSKVFADYKFYLLKDDRSACFNQIIYMATRSYLKFKSDTARNTHSSYKQASRQAKRPLNITFLTCQHIIINKTFKSLKHIQIQLGTHKNRIPRSIISTCDTVNKNCNCQCSNMR